MRGLGTTGLVVVLVSVSIRPSLTWAVFTTVTSFSPLLTLTWKVTVSVSPEATFLSPGYGTCSWVVGAAVISGAINISCVLWDNIGDGDIASSVGSVGVGNGVSEHLTSSYLVAIDGVTLTVQDVLLWLRQNYPNAMK